MPNFTSPRPLCNSYYWFELAADCRKMSWPAIAQSHASYAPINCHYAHRHVLTVVRLLLIIMARLIASSADIWQGLSALYRLLRKLQVATFTFSLPLCQSGLNTNHKFRQSPPKLTNKHLWPSVCSGSIYEHFNYSVHSVADISWVSDLNSGEASNVT